MTVKRIKGEDWYIIFTDHDGNKPELPKVRHSMSASLYGPKIEARVEWSLLPPRGGHGIGARVGYNGAESDLGLDIYLGRLGSFWTRLQAPWTAWARVSKKQSPEDWYHARHTGVRLFPWQGCIIQATVGEREGTSSKGDPWWRDMKITHTDFWGRTKTTTEIMDMGSAVVPMPEGKYEATWKHQKFVSRYTGRLGKIKDAALGPRSHSTYWLEIPGGIPAEGKGENSWDCGMDGLFGCGGQTLEEAIGRAVSSSLRDRSRHGGPHNLPHPMTVSEAEKFVAG